MRVLAQKYRNPKKRRIPVDGDFIDAPGLDMIDKALLWGQSFAEARFLGLRVLEARIGPARDGAWRGTRKCGIE